MGRAEAGSTKAIANAIKAKGLGRLRWYCQVCEKQCRDENGFQAHTKSESHLRKILLLGPKAGAAISDYSSQFQSEFMTLLRTRHLTNRVQANKVYNEYIQDKHHIHMNATRWVTLGGFIGTIGKAGLVRVDEDEKGLWIQWIDNRPETLSKQAALQKRDRAQMDGEERERLALQEQISRAKAQEEARIAEAGGEVDGALQKKEGERISLSFQPVSVTGAGPGAGAGDAGRSGSQSETAAGPSGGASTPAAVPGSTSISFGSAKSTTLPAPANPLKRPASTNIFKSVKPKAAKTDDGNESAQASAPKKYTSEAERLMKEDQARKAARSGASGSGGGAGYGGFGPVRTSKPNLGRTY